MRIAIVAIILLLSAGCGRGSVQTVEDPAQDSLDGMKQCLSEALGSVRALTAPPPPPAATADPTDATASVDDSSEPDMVAPLPAALRSVVAAAQDLVNASSGKPIEADAKGILSSAQELENKANNPSAVREIEQGLQQLLSKVKELRQKP